MPNTGQILIADDADSLLLPITDMLRLEGYECNYVPDPNTVIDSTPRSTNSIYETSCNCLP